MIITLLTLRFCCFIVYSGREEGRKKRKGREGTRTGGKERERKRGEKNRKEGKKQEWSDILERHSKDLVAWDWDLSWEF